MKSKNFVLLIVHPRKLFNKVRTLTEVMHAYGHESIMTDVLSLALARKLLVILLTEDWSDFLSAGIVNIASVSKPTDVATVDSDLIRIYHCDSCQVSVDQVAKFQDDCPGLLCADSETLN